MTIKTLSAIAVVAAALSSPAFAQEPTVDASVTHKPAYTRHFRNTYNQAPGYAAQRAGEGWLDEAYGLDRSRPGDRDPDLNPPGN